MKQLFFLLLLMSIFLVACKDSSDMSANEQKEVEGEVKDMLYKYCADIKAKGLQAEFDHIDNSKGFFWVPPGAVGPLPFDTIISMIGNNASRFKEVNNTFDTLIVIPLSKRLAEYSARVHSIVTDTAGKQTVTNLVETGLVIKRNTGWKLLSGQTSVCDMPGQ